MSLSILTTPRIVLSAAIMVGGIVQIRQIIVANTTSTIFAIFVAIRMNVNKEGSIALADCQN
ncbi:hypothetical protein ACO0LB_17900 [Undibacterium sp. SXout7W]|uniref:hypothetical protein n=1 Tax=Undibacterium sp. SXout7W TaxID=3413049 RepID=UPI003BF3B717